MNCYDCANHHTATPAVAICHDCGAGVCPDHAITTAIRFGAATMEAQDQTNQRFIQFCSDHTRQLDSPPLVISP